MKKNIEIYNDFLLKNKNSCCTCLKNYNRTCNVDYNGCEYDPATIKDFNLFLRKLHRGNSKKH